MGTFWPIFGAVTLNAHRPFIFIDIIVSNVFLLKLFACLLHTNQNVIDTILCAQHSVIFRTNNFVNKVINLLAIKTRLEL